MTGCLNNCGQPARGRGQFCSGPCRTAHWKLKKALEGLTPTEARRLVDRQAKRAARARGSIPSDDRISYRRAVQAVADWMLNSGRVDPSVAELEAAEVLARARPKGRA